MSDRDVVERKVVVVNAGQDRRSRDENQWRYQGWRIETKRESRWTFKKRRDQSRNEYSKDRAMAPAVAASAVDSTRIRQRVEMQKAARSVAFDWDKLRYARNEREKVLNGGLDGASMRRLRITNSHACDHDRWWWTGACFSLGLMAATRMASRNAVSSQTHR